MRTTYLACTAVLALTAAMPAAAADLAAPVEQVVVTGAKPGDFGVKSGIPIEQVPQSIQVLDQKDFLERNVQSIGDMLRGVPSATAGAPRISTYQAFSVKLRGFAADQMRNGVRMRYYANIDPSATANIDRVEVLKGPSAVLYGEGAVGGIISIITKRPQHDFAASISPVFGSYDQKAASFDVTGPVAEDAGLYFRVTGEIERSGSYIDYTDLNRTNLNGALTWEANDWLTLYTVGEWSERITVRTPGLPVVGTVVSNGVARIPSNTFLGEPGRNDFKVSGQLFQAWADIKLSDTWSLTPRVSMAGFNGRYSELLVRAVAVDKVTVNRTGRYDEEHHRDPIQQLDLNGAFSALGMRHNLLIGGEKSQWHVNYFEQTIPSPASINALNPVYGLVPAGPYPVTTVNNDRVDSWATYAQDRVDLTDRWNLIVGVRSDWYDIHRDRAANFTATPVVVETSVNHEVFQVGTTYKLDGGWSVFGGYATGFNIAPAVAQRSFDGTPFNPEESSQYEAGVRYAYGALSGSASLFQINRTNVVTADPNHAGYSIQTGDVRARGFEFEGSWQVDEALSLEAGYAYEDSKVVRSNSGNLGFQVADTPKHRANLFALYDIPGLPAQLRAGLNYVGSRAFTDTANVTLMPGLLANSVKLPAYTTVDLGASYAFQHARLDLSLRNITNEVYYTRDFNNFSVIPGDPREVSLRVTFGL